MSLFRNVAGLMATSAALVPIGFVTSIVLARFLSVEDRGVYATVLAFAELVAILSELGWPGASVYLLRRARHEAAQVAAVGLLAISVIAALVVSACVALAPGLVARFLPGASAEVFHLAVSIVPCLLLAHVTGAIARASSRFYLWNAYRLAISLGIVIAMTFVLVVRGGALAEALWALLAVHAVVTLWLVVAVLRHTGFSLRFRNAGLGDGLRFGLKSHLQILAGRVHDRVDIFMIAYFLAEPAQLAFYAIAAGLVQRLSMLPQAVFSAVYPHMSSLDAAEAGNLACQTNRQTLAWVLLVALPLGAVGHVLLPLLYGEDYVASVLPFIVMLPGIVLLSIYTSLGQLYFTAVDRQGYPIAAQIAGLTINVALNLWLIPRHGILGAAIANACSHAFKAGLITTVFARETGHRMRQIFMLGRGDLDPYRRRLAALRRPRDAG
jgi:O-antigen/teichoic acid export membrane protein